MEGKWHHALQSGCDYKTIEAHKNRASLNCAGFHIHVKTQHTQGLAFFHEGRRRGSRPSSGSSGGDGAALKNVWRNAVGVNAVLGFGSFEAGYKHFPLRTTIEASDPGPEGEDYLKMKSLCVSHGGRAPPSGSYRFYRLSFISNLWNVLLSRIIREKYDFITGLETLTCLSILATILKKPC